MSSSACGLQLLCAPPLVGELVAGISRDVHLVASGYSWFWSRHLESTDLPAMVSQRSR